MANDTSQQRVHPQQQAPAQEFPGSNGPERMRWEDPGHHITNAEEKDPTMTLKSLKTSAIKASVQTVTPEDAVEILATANTSNRALNKEIVQAYSEDINKGAWLIAEPIMFDTQGMLIDGQHRLAAIIESGSPQEMLIATGYEPSVRLLIDTGKRRNANDALDIAGIRVNNKSTVTGIARLSMLYERGGLMRIPSNGGMTFANWDIVEWITNNPDVEDFAMRARKVSRILEVSPQAFGFCARILQSINEETMVNFEERVLGFERAGPRDPVVQLEQALKHYGSDRASRGDRQQGLRHHQQVALIFLAWNRLRGVDKAYGALFHKEHSSKFAIGADMPVPL